LLLVGLMVRSPAFLSAAERMLRPAQSLLDATSDRIFSGRQAAIEVFAGLPLICFVVVVIHEIGHLIMGLCVGFRLVSIRFGPIRISPPFHISFKVERKTGAAGLVSMIPLHTKHLRVRATVFILGGSLTNLIAGVVVMFVLAPGSILMAWFGIFSLVIGAANLVPFRNRAMLSDGKRVLMLLRNRERGERWLALLQLGAELRRGVDPEALSRDFLAKATAVKDDSADTVVGHVFAYAAAWYQKKDDEVAQLLETCLEYSGFTPPAVREVLKSDAAVFQARKRKRIELAEQWLSEIPEKTQFPGLRLRAQAAILEAQGDIEGALKKLDESESAIMQIRDPYQKSASLRSLQRWKLELLEMKSSCGSISFP
jgi:hypothetical protein